MTEPRLEPARPGAPEGVTAHLVYELGRDTYHVPFDAHRMVAGAVLFGSTKNPPLVLGMASPGKMLDELEEAAKSGNEQAVAAYRMLEEYQYDELVKAGVAPDFATERRDLTGS